ncbi:Gfo/Idh/MocA family oxidoreductase [Streptomyces sp. M19]
MAALCDPNPVRIAHHQRLLREAGEPEAAPWRPEEFQRRLRADGIDEVVVTTVDVLHDAYIVPALRAGCRVVTEKPMTTDAVRCRRILDTVRETGNHLSVAFNYRYNPVHEEVRRQLARAPSGRCCPCTSSGCSTYGTARTASAAGTARRSTAAA